MPTSKMNPQIYAALEKVIASSLADDESENRRDSALARGRQQPFTDQIPEDPPIEEEGNRFYLWDRGELGASKGKDFELLDVARAAVNFIPSLGKNAVDIISAIASPLDTLDGMVQLGGGVLEKALDTLGVDKKGRYKYITPMGDITASTEKGKRQRALVDSAYSFYLNRYGKDVRRTLTEDPAGALLDFASFLGGAGIGIRATSAATRIKSLSSIGKAVQQAGRQTGRAATAPLRAVPAIARKATGLENGEGIGGALASRIGRSLFTKGRPMQSVYQATKEGPFFGHPIAKRIKAIQSKTELFDPAEETSTAARKGRVLLNRMENEFLNAWEAVKPFSIEAQASLASGIKKTAVRYLEDEWRLRPVRAKAVEVKGTTEYIKARELADKLWKKSPKVWERDINNNIKFNTSSEVLSNSIGLRYIKESAGMILDHADFSKSGIRPLGTNLRRLFNRIPTDGSADDALKVVGKLQKIYRSQLSEVSPEAAKANQIWAKRQQYQGHLKNALNRGMDPPDVSARERFSKWIQDAATSPEVSINERRLVIGELERQMNMLMQAPYSAHKLSKIMPSIGLRETMYTAVSVLGVLNPWLFTGLIPLALSSPRMQGNIARWLGASTRAAKKFEDWHTAFTDVIPDDLLRRGLTYGHLMDVMLSRGVRFPDPPAVPFKDPDKDFYEKHYGPKSKDKPKERRSPASGKYFYERHYGKPKNRSRKSPAAAKALGF